MHRRVESAERLEREQPQDVARAGQTAGAEPGSGPVEAHRTGKRLEARREVGDDRGAGRGDALSAMRVLVHDHPAQELHRRRRGNREPSVRGVDAAPADGERPARPRGVEVLDQPGRADDVRDRVPGPDLVEAHVVDGHAVHRGLRRGEPREHVEGPGTDAGVQIGAFEQGADVAVEMMLVRGRPAVAVAVAAVRVRPAVPATRLVHRKARAGQRIVGVVDALDGGDGVEPGARESRDERRPRARARRRAPPPRTCRPRRLRRDRAGCAWAIL